MGTSQPLTQLHVNHHDKARGYALKRLMRDLLQDTKDPDWGEWRQPVENQILTVPNHTTHPSWPD